MSGVVVGESLILGVESSCDDTAAAVLRGGREILGHTIATQDVHSDFGGIVPEVASRAQLRVIDRVVTRTLVEAGTRLDEIDAFAVTAGPGLIGSLLVGVNWVKAAAYALDRPFVGVHHMEAHLFATVLEDEGAAPPFVGLLVSGGHTLLVHAARWGRYRVLGETRDDAAGEAFDKVARLLGLGYPGGPEIERLAKRGHADRYDLPVPMVRSGRTPTDADYFDMSFSGLKTAVQMQVREVADEGRLGEEVAHLCAAFQRAALEQLVEKTARAVETTGCPRVVLGGGVARNRALSLRMRERLGSGVELFVPSPRLATDNAAMVARAGYFRLGQGARSDLHLNAEADLEFPGVTDRGADRRVSGDHTN